MKFNRKPPDGGLICQTDLRIKLDKLAVHGAIKEGLFHCVVGQSESLRHEVNAQHRLKQKRRSAVFPLGVVQRDELDLCGPMPNAADFKQNSHLRIFLLLRFKSRLLFYMNFMLAGLAYALIKHDGVKQSFLTILKIRHARVRRWQTSAKEAKHVIAPPPRQCWICEPLVIALKTRGTLIEKYELPLGSSSFVHTLRQSGLSLR